MSRIIAFLLATLAVANSVAGDIRRQEPVLSWERLPATGEAGGLAGAFVGVSDDSLIIAGGLSRPVDDSQNEGVPASYSDRIYILPEPGAAWSLAKQRLLRPVAYGVSLSWDDGLVCLGGGNAQEHYAEAFIVRLEEGSLRITDLPSLPAPAKYACASPTGRYRVCGRRLGKPRLHSHGGELLVTRPFEVGGRSGLADSRIMARAIADAGGGRCTRRIRLCLWRDSPC